MAIDARQAADPLGRAMLDYQRGEYGALRYRDGARTRDGRVAEYYFQSPESWDEERVALLERIADWGGPVLDVGCGEGRHARWFQNRGLEVTGIDVSPNAVQAARERGTEDVRVMDMFDMTFDRDRFRTVHVIGSQLGLASSFAGVRDLLESFARVTDADGRAVVHNYDPNAIDGDLFGYRPDPRDGVAHRCFHFEYVPDGMHHDGSTAPERVEGDSRAGDTRASDGTNREVGPSLHFLLFGPDRLADTAVGTPWRVADVVRTDGTYLAVLEKR